MGFDLEEIVFGKKETRKKNVEIVFAEKKIEQQYYESDSVLFNRLTNAFKRIKMHPTIGRSVPKRKIPKKFIRKYQITNLFIYDLSKSMRLLSLKHKEILILAIIIEWGPHKWYKRTMGFR